MTVLEPVVAWLIRCKKKQVTLTMVMEGADRPRCPVLKVMDRLARDGYLEEVQDNPAERKYRQRGPDKRNPTWKILDKPLSLPTNKVNKPTLRDKMWKVIRVKRQFTFAHIQRLSGASYSMARQYVNLLARNGYVRKTGIDHRKITWLLIRGHNQVARPAMKEKTDE